MTESLLDLWPLFVSLAHIAAATAVTVDAVLRKRQVQSIIGWVGLAWLAPFVGAFVYLCFGINRIRRAAAALNLQDAVKVELPPVAALFADATDARYFTLAGLERLGLKVTNKPLLPGNRIAALENGDAAYPQMLAAIDDAQRSIALQTYIFDNDEVGEAFAAALHRAAERGVAVRVLIDDVGARYARPPMVRVLRRLGLTAATFLPTRAPRLFRYANLRNHRKILIADGRIGFTGGMNLRAGHYLGRSPKHPVRCLHFRLEGPIVADMQRTFLNDWAFATGERLDGDPWLPALAHCGPVIARGIVAGPDEDLGKMPEILLGALSAARHSVRIITPYFLPDDVLLRTLQVTALRGIEVEIVLPARSNIPLLDWAMKPQLPYLLEKGCRVYLSPPPFDHTKLFVVDGCWSLIGSTNWDARSLRLNFEYNIECYDPQLAHTLEALVAHRIACAQRLDMTMLDRSPLTRLRNGLARLGSPYL